MDNFRLVTIDLDTYNALQEARFKLDLLLDTIYNTAKLGWNKNILELNEAALNVVLECIDPAYLATLHALQEQDKEKKNGDD